jgi:methyl coenzyme M reductase subunit D
MPERKIQQICLWILPLDTDIEYGRFTRMAFAVTMDSSYQGGGTSIDLNVAPTSVTPIP